jgi:hypothetical protein
MGAVPIYWGGITEHQGLNQDSALIINTNENLKIQIGKIANLDENHYKAIFQKALMNREPNWDAIVEQILFWIKSWK